MISDLLSTRPVGTNTSLTTKVASAVDQDKSESFTLLGLPIGLPAEPLLPEGVQWAAGAEQPLDIDTAALTFIVPVAQGLPQSPSPSLLNTEINSAPIIQDGLAATPQASLVSPTAIAPFVPVILPAETVKADLVGRTPTSLIGLSATDQRGILFSSGMTSSMALAGASAQSPGSGTQPASLSGDTFKMSSTFTQDSTLAPFSGDFEHLKSDTALFQRVLAELRGHEAKDINAIGTQQLAGTQAASATQWGPVSLTPTASLAQQSQEILTPLREHLRFQVDQHIKKAELRLDPPELGKIELNIRLEGDRLQVQMHAVNPAIRDALLNGLDRLRVDLAMDHGGQIDVDIGQGESQQHQQETALLSSSIAAETTADNVVDVMAREKSQLDLLA